MFAAITVYRNRVREWLQDKVRAGGGNDRATVVAANAAVTVVDATTTAAVTAVDATASTAAVTAVHPTATATAMDRVPRDDDKTPAAAAVESVSSAGVAAPSPSRAIAEERPQTRPEAAAPPPTTSFSTDEEYMCAATVLSSMPEDMPLPPLAYTRRRSSSKTHTRLYRIRLPPKPRRAKR